MIFKYYLGVNLVSLLQILFQRSIHQTNNLQDQHTQ